MKPIVPRFVRFGIRFPRISGRLASLAKKWQKQKMPLAAVLPQPNINENNQLLVVNERFRRDQTKPYYKLPGGAVDPAENISKAAEREVMEETGIYTQFIGIVCLRHRHGFRFGTSDLYIVCRLKPLSKEITSDPHEIENCKWMPLTNYFSSDYVADFNKKIVQKYIRIYPI